MFYFRPQAIAEAAIVGGVLAVIAWMISSKFKSPLVSHFVAGALMHISFELMGVHHHFARSVVAYEDSQNLSLPGPIAPPTPPTSPTPPTV